MSRWGALLARFPTTLDAETFLCFLAHFTALDRYLAVWRGTRTRPALAHLAVAVYEPFTSSFWPCLESRTENILQKEV